MCFCRFVFPSEEMVSHRQTASLDVVLEFHFIFSNESCVAFCARRWQWLRLWSVHLSMWHILWRPILSWNDWEVVAMWLCGWQAFRLTLCALPFFFFFFPQLREECALRNLPKCTLHDAIPKWSRATWKKMFSTHVRFCGLKPLPFFFLATLQHNCPAKCHVWMPCSQPVTHRERHPSSRRCYCLYSGAFVV